MTRRVKEVDFDKVAKIRAMLESDDRSLQRKGLLEFSFLGEECCDIIDAALKFIYDAENDVRAYVMAGAISCTNKLNQNQVSKILILADDPDDLVRGRVIALLGALDIEVMRASLNEFGAEDFAKYNEAISYIENKYDDIQVIFDKYVSQKTIEATFKLASLERMARSGYLKMAPNYTGDDYLALSCVANIQRLISRASRINDRLSSS